MEGTHLVVCGAFRTRQGKGWKHFIVCSIYKLFFLCLFGFCHKVFCCYRRVRSQILWIRAT
jgi:hypothetical protein